jgi:hypothetical protein
MEALTNASGALRDALAGLNNLAQLLRSRNVAPKAIAQVLVELPGTCDAIVPEFERLIARPLAAPLVLNSPARLAAFLNTQVGLFTSAIERASKRSVNAAARLALENAVLQVAHQLGGALPLVELWTDLRTEWRSLDLVELLSLSRIGDQPQTPGAVARDVTLVAPEGILPVVAPPRAVLNLLGLCASLADPKRQTKGFVLEAKADAANPTVWLALTPADTQQSGFTLLLPPHVEPTEAGVRDAAAVMGLNIRIEATGITLMLAG